MTFGSFIKACRIAQQLTLRECAKRSNISLSDWSKMERDVNTAPRNRDRYLAIAGTLEIECQVGSLYSVYACDSYVTPTSIVTENDIDDHMPAFLPLTPEQTAALRPLVKESLTRNVLF